MATQDELIEFIREHVKRRRGITERKMFGGTAFMVNGNMFCGPVDHKLMVRLGNEGVAKALDEPHTSEMDFTGKVIKSMLFVDTRRVKPKALKDWIDRGLKFARTLPSK